MPPTTDMGGTPLILDQDGGPFTTESQPFRITIYYYKSDKGNNNIFNLV